MGCFVSKKIILQLCADTGSDTKPYQDDPEYEVILVGSSIGVENYHPPKNVYGIIANPPCTEFSIARIGGKARNPEEGMKLVNECQRIISECEKDSNLHFWAIENPATGALRNYLGNPDYAYQPWWYGSPWTKKTALWGKFNIPQRKYLDWDDVDKNADLYIRKRKEGSNNRFTGKPEMHNLHKSAWKFIEEFHCLPEPQSDMEFRSTCSQNFAKAFFEANK